MASALPLRCAYDANKHGWTASAFHERVNTFGAAVVVAKTEGGAVIGGYNPSGERQQRPAWNWIFSL